MYCPICGQQQISDEMKFCSRCGLSLSNLAEWLAHGGPPARRDDDSQVAAVSPRRKGIRRAAKLMFFSGVVFAVCLPICLAVDEGGPLILPIVLFFVALVLMLYARLFSDKNPPVHTPVVLTPAIQNPTVSLNPTPGSLPPATNIATLPIGRQRVRTNELAQPRSVTENTTKLLDD
jgi:hypothetical protein